MQEFGTRDVLGGRLEVPVLATEFYFPGCYSMQMLYRMDTVLGVFGFSTVIIHNDNHVVHAHPCLAAQSFRL